METSDKLWIGFITSLIVGSLAVMIWAMSAPNREANRCEATDGVPVSVSGALLLVESGQWKAEPFKSSWDQVCAYRK